MNGRPSRSATSRPTVDLPLAGMPTSTMPGPASGIGAAPSSASSAVAHDLDRRRRDRSTAAKLAAAWRSSTPAPPRARRPGARGRRAPGGSGSAGRRGRGRRGRRAAGPAGTGDSSESVPIGRRVDQQVGAFEQAGERFASARGRPPPRTRRRRPGPPARARRRAARAKHRRATATDAGLRQLRAQRRQVRVVGHQPVAVAHDGVRGAEPLAPPAPARRRGSQTASLCGCVTFAPMRRRPAQRRHGAGQALGGDVAQLVARVHRQRARRRRCAWPATPSSRCRGRAARRDRVIASGCSVRRRRRATAARRSPIVSPPNE